MTWWLHDGQPDQPVPAPATPDLPITTFGEGLGAAWDTAVRSNNRFWTFENRVADDEATTADEVVKRLGMQNVFDGLRQRGIITPSSEGYGWDFLRYQTDARRAVLEMGADAASREPEAWQGVDLSREGAEARVIEAQKREAQEHAEIIAMSPYPMLETFLGEVGAATADPRQWPLLLINPGGSFLKTVAWQAGLSGVSTAVDLPSRMEVAERLGEPAPNPLAEIGIGMAGGAVLGGIFEGIMRAPGAMARLPAALRGVAIQAERSAPVAKSPQIEAAVNAAEEALRRDAPVEPAVRSVIGEPMEPPPDLAAQWQEIDARTDWEPIFSDANSRAVEPQVDTAPDGPDPLPAPIPRAEQRGTIAADLARAEDDLKKTAKWFSRYIRRQGGIHPEGVVADELRHAGITHKTMPGLFSRKGARDLDNLDVATDAEAAAAIGVDGFYLDRQGVIDSLITELSGGRIKTPRDEMLLGEVENLRKALRGLDLEDQIDTAAGPVTLSPRERTYVKEKIAAGDTTDDAVHDAIARQFDEAEANRVPDDVYEREADWTPFRDDEFRGQAESIRGTGAGDPARPDAERGSAGAGTTGAGAAFASEATPAGQQTLIPGTELRARDTSKAKALAALQAKQSKMRRLDQQSPEGLFAAKQVSIFDDPTSPEAIAYMDAQIADMRATVQSADPDLPVPKAEDDPAGAAMREAIAEADEMDQMEREFANCLAGGVNVGA